MSSLSKIKNVLVLALLMVGGAAYSAPAGAGWRHGYGGYGYDREVVRHVYRPVVRRHVVVHHVYRPVVRERVVIHHYPVYRPHPRPIYVRLGSFPVALSSRASPVARSMAWGRRENVLDRALALSVSR
jgi:hypothetical protein